MSFGLRCARALALHQSADLSSLGPRVTKVRAPTLVVWGERDPFGPMHLGRQLANELAGARFEPIARAGHSPHEEAPERVAEIVLAEAAATQAAPA